MNNKTLFYTIVSLVLLWSCSKDDGTKISKSSLADDSTSFITRWKIDNKQESIMIGTNDDLSIAYDYTIDWGDGTVEELSEGNPKHTYTASGTYVVAIKGQFPSLKIDEFLFGREHSSDLISLEQWGSIKWQSLEYAFQKCENMKYNAKDAPNLSEATSLSYMFEDAKDFLGADLNHWDVSNITNMQGTFSRTPSTNLDVSKWDVSNVTNMEGMFAGSDFNTSIGDWDVGKVTNMDSMFGAAKFFNQDISGWNVANVVAMPYMFAGTGLYNQDIGEWNISNVTNMKGMFSAAKSFNQDLSEWNVSKVTDIRALFHYAESFNQDLGSWDVSNIESLAGMFDESGMSAENYSKTLFGWGEQEVQQNVTLGAIGIFYCIGSEGEVSRNLLKNINGWNIADEGGVDCQ